MRMRNRVLRLVLLLSVAGPLAVGCTSSGSSAPDTGAAPDGATVPGDTGGGGADAGDATVGTDASPTDASDAGSPDSGAPPRPDAGPSDSGTCAGPLSGLLGWWRGELNADDALDAANGVWTGTSTYAPGQVGHAFSFDGSNHVLAPFTHTGTFTVDLWVKAKVAGQGVYAAPLSSSLGGQDPYFQIDFDGAGSYRLQAGDDRLHVPIGAASTMAFQHLAVSYDGVVIRTYLDGAFTSSAAWPGAPLQFQALKLGLNRTENAPFTGLLDEVHVFGRVLSADEIRSLHAAGAYGLCR